MDNVEEQVLSSKGLEIYKVIIGIIVGFSFAYIIILVFKSGVRYFLLFKIFGFGDECVPTRT